MAKFLRLTMAYGAPIHLRADMVATLEKADLSGAESEWTNIHFPQGGGVKVQESPEDILDRMRRLGIEVEIG